jgi:hypothetical protein
MAVAIADQMVLPSQARAAGYILGCQLNMAGKRRSDELKKIHL